MSFEELPHTADVKIRAHAPTLETLFSEALRALMQVMYGDDREGGILREVDIEAPDDEELLADFLSEILFISEVDGLVFAGADIRIHGTTLHAVLDGELFDRVRHAGGSEVKGISYSGLSITRDTNGYMLDIIFDV
ncbi:archease [Methanoregula sp.]|uniref:archease n=1 Tax=Methanoregula sp. TaxID=2052170 RepID=UPI00236A96E8|nr:archease [Methanoregula sp.]MDD1687130.1 archease [Methanoregula sp.]